MLILDRTSLAERAYWIERLAGEPRRAGLRHDFERPPRRAAALAGLTVVVPPPVCERVRALTGDGAFLTYTTLLAAMKVCLLRHTREATVVVGSPARRTEGNAAPNALAILDRLDPSVSFRDLLLAVRKTLLEAYARQSYPVSRLMSDLGVGPPDGVDSRPRLFEVALALDDIHDEMPDAGQDITLRFRRSPGRLEGTLLFDEGLDARATMARFASGFVTLLGEAVEQPERPLAALRMMSPEEERAILGGAFEGADALPPRPPESAAVGASNLTKNQVLVWLGQKLWPGVPLYNMAMTFTVRGDVDAGAFAQAFAATVAGSDALRTVVTEHDGVPRGEVLEHVADPIEVVDLRDGDAGAWIAARVARPFDLGRRAFDAALVRCSGGWIFYVSAHHLVIDGWSEALVYRRTAEAYEALLAGTPIPARADPPFREYVGAERAYRASAEAAAAEAYWARRLAAPPEPIRWFGRPRSRGSTGVERRSSELGVERSRRLRELVKRPGLFSLTEDFSLFAAFAALVLAHVHRLTGRRSFGLGVVFHNRPGKRFRDTIGLFMEVCPVLVTVSDDDTFASLVPRVTAELRAGLRHCRHTTGNAFGRELYDVLLNYQTASFGPLAGEPVDAAWAHPGHGTETLGVEIRDYGRTGSFGLDLDVSLDVFDPPRRAACVALFLELCDGVLADPDRPLDDLGCARAAARPAATVLDLISDQARRRPDHPAVEDDGGALTYAELDARAGAMARELASLGAGPEVPVGVLARGGIAWVTALLGVLRAGAACVPLDPGHPAERLRATCAGAGVALLVIDAAAGVGAPVSGVPVLMLGGEPAPRAGAEPCRGPVAARSLAWIVHTSGSTGAPKGVELEHGALLDYVRAARAAFDLQPDDRLLQFASPAVDTVLEEIFTCLASGAALVLRSGDPIDAPPRLLDACRRRGVTVLDLPTAYFHELCSCVAQGVDVDPRLRLVVIGGERVAPARARAFQRWAGQGVRLLNTYGPTEGTIVATMHAVADRDTERAEIPLGKPVPGVTARVLDELMRPVPIGVPGELYLGGAAPARGYRGAPEATAAGFVPDPFSRVEGARLYRTGDRCVLHPDGALEFAGRIDDQVKIRGHRVEPGDVEAALAAHPGLREVAVVARERAPGDLELVAYVVPAEEGAADPGSLRAHLAARLPSYMVPARYVVLDALPRLPNLKVDRRALPAPPADASLPGSGPAAPRTPEEQRIAELWAEVLGVPRIGVDDSFFERGGHSLLAVRMLARLHRLLSVDVPLRTLFERPTVAGLAAEVARLRAAPPAAREGRPAVRVPRRPDPARPWPLSLAQEDLWPIVSLLPRSPDLNMSAAIRLVGPLDAGALEQSIREVTERHEILRSVLRPEGDGAVHVLLPARFALPVVEIGGSAPEQAAAIGRLAREDASLAIDVTRAPGLRATLLRLAPEHHVLLLTMHHIVGDGWSLRVFFREVGALYAARLAGAPSPLRDLPIQYADHAAWQREEAARGTWAGQLAHWRAALGGGLPPVELPLDRPRGAVPSIRTAAVAVAIEPALVDALRGAAARDDATVFMVLLAGLSLLVRAESGAPEARVGTVVANRTLEHELDLVGLFLNTVVVRVPLGDDPDFREALRRVRAATLDAFANQEVPFGAVVRALEEAGHADVGGLFRVLFVYHDEAAATLALEGLREASLVDEHLPAPGVKLTAHDLILDLRSLPEGIVGSLTYKSELFDDSSARRLAAGLKGILERGAGHHPASGRAADG